MATYRTINQLLARPPKIGGQEADPLNGGCSIPSHGFSLLDDLGQITNLISVSDTPFNRTFLTAGIDAAVTDVPVEDLTGFPTKGDIFLDRETIYYGGTDTDSKTAQTAALALTGQTATGGDKHTISDTARSEADHYFEGAILTVTAGTNNGEVRTIKTSWYDSDVPIGYLQWDSPMPAACDATTVYQITTPPNRIKCTTLTEAANYWKGAVVEITSGTNSGLVVWVQSFDATDDILELITPLPTPCDATSQFNISLSKFTSCERGQYGSDAVAHDLVDENGALVQRPVSDKLPFLKTRRVYIYENRVGLDESEAIRAVGYIDDYQLNSDGTTYDFSCSGLLKILSKKLMSSPAKTQIARAPLWGGFFQAQSKVALETETIGGAHITRGTVTWYLGFALSDGRGEGFSVNKIWIKAEDYLDFPRDGGNIKIDNEIIHYESRGYDTDRFLFELIPRLKLGDTDIELDVDESGEQTGTLVFVDGDITTIASLNNRGLFAEKVGADNIRNDLFISEKSQNLLTDNPGLLTPDPPEVKAYLQEHSLGAEVIQVCVCENSIKSDFPRYDYIEYSSLSGGSFAVGDTVVGGTSAVEATVMQVTEDGTNGTLLVAFADPYWWGYAVAETISVGGVSATVDVYEQEIRPRNNAIDVILQLIMSSGTVGQNGAYDTLPSGFGIDLSSDLVDVALIETLRDKYFANVTIDFVLHEEMSALEWLQQHIFKPLQVFPFETYAGKIGLAALMTDAEARVENEGSTYTEFDGDHIEANQLPDWTSGKPPIAKAVIKYNKHPVEDEYLSSLEMIFGNSKEWYKDLGRNIKTEIGVFYYSDTDIRSLSHRNAKLPALMRRMTSVLWDRQAQYPCPVVTCVTPYHDIANNVGDGVVLTHPSLPNLRTGLIGLESEYYQILGRHPDPAQGIIRWLLWQIGVHDSKFARRAPSGYITAYAADTPSAGKSRITLRENHFASEGNQDVESFIAGMEVACMTNTYGIPGGGGSPENATIESVDIPNNQIVLDQNLTNTPSAGYFLEYALFDDCTTGQQEGRVFLADVNRLLGASDDSAFKYM